MQFICDRGLSLDNSADGDDTLYIMVLCMRSVMKFFGITFSEKSVRINN